MSDGGGGNGGSRISTGYPLPLKIVSDILSRLPIKSVARFEAVSKPFAALIKSPDFVSAHLRRHSPTGSSFLIRRLADPTVGGFHFSLIDGRAAAMGDIPIPFMDSLSRFPKIVGSCCGLVCLDISMRHASAFLLWNIATRKVGSVPRSRIFVERPPFWMVAVGFGSNCDNSDIKLVRIVYFKRRMEELPLVRAEVFSWGLGRWSLIDADATQAALQSCSITEGQKAVAANGALHWVGVEIEKPSMNKYIVSLDLGTEEFSRVPTPDYGSEFPTCVQVMGFKGMIGLAAYPAQSFKPSPYKFIDLWTLDDGIRWTKITSLRPDFIGIGIPVGILNDSELIMKREEGQYVHISSFDGNGRVKWNIPVFSVPEFACEVYGFVDSVYPVAPFEEVDAAEG
ncbi:unnamed protein product [Linum tenue]|uniref:F-box domain-containing protein n=1 Tax=Linum tenue TaxID=586396 RepID=A0AAV0Q9V2_9ROSI|nr:unnamed protein product [Linum tenue]